MRRPDSDHDAVCASMFRHRVVVAPPGTGKTHLAVRLAGSLVKTLPAPPEPATTIGARVLLLTFSNQARTQLEREADRQLGSNRDRVVITNYHALFWSAVRAHRRALCLPSNLDLGGNRRRTDALTAAAPAAVKQLKNQTGLLEAFAEQAFPAFRDERSPNEDVINRLLVTVEAEQQAGRLVFDDLGALFWKLLERFPTLEAAYRTRFPVVIADEHQDASALQDAVTRRLGSQTLVVLADPLQLIHGFRGARAERLDAHRSECGREFTLRTPHRWHTHLEAGRWLLAVRERLLDEHVDAPRPATARVVNTPSERSFNGILFPVKQAVSAAFDAGASRVAVLARRNDQVGQIRTYLTKNAMYPREAAGSTEFEEARADIEQLPAYPDLRGIAAHLVDRLDRLVPGLERTVVKQIKARLKAETVHTKGCGPKAAPILAELTSLYREGAGAYFTVLVAALDACIAAGQHIPQTHTVRVLREAATNGSGELSEALEVYAHRAAAATQAAPREDRGLFVMTAHQSKGKEFDAVILAGATASSFPDTPDARRLFYVAITRGSSRWTFVTPEDQASPLLAAI